MGTPQKRYLQQLVVAIYGPRLHYWAYEVGRPQHGHDWRGAPKLKLNHVDDALAEQRTKYTNLPSRLQRNSDLNHASNKETEGTERRIEYTTAQMRMTFEIAMLPIWAIFNSNPTLSSRVCFPLVRDCGSSSLFILINQQIRTPMKSQALPRGLPRHAVHHLYKTLSRMRCYEIT